MRAIAGSSNKALLSVTGALEAAAGLLLLVAPSLVVELLLGTPPGGPAGITVSRVAGVALLALGVACWLAREDTDGGAAKEVVTAMLLYNAGVMAVLVLAWTSGAPVGVAFWPVVSAHAGLAVWCGATLSTRTVNEIRS